MRFLRFLLALCLFLNGSPADTLYTPPALKSVTMSFVGDCTVSTNLGASGRGSLNWYAANYEPEYFLEKVADVFRDDDFTLVNCETVLSDRALTPVDKGEGTNYWFLGPASNAGIFSASGVEIAAFANNHMNDYGSAGVADTIAALEAAGLTVAKNNVPLYVEKNGITIGILACGLWYGGGERELYDELDQMTKNSDLQIIYPHGGAEGTYEVEGWRKTAFHNLIDRGADLVIGTHAHRLQPVEEYNGGIIVYGLGNFCFGGNTRPENRTAIFQCTVTQGPEGLELESRVLPCYVYTGQTNNWQPALMDEDDPNYQKVLDFMAGRGSSPV